MSLLEYQEGDGKCIIERDKAHGLVRTIMENDKKITASEFLYAFQNSHPDKFDKELEEMGIFDSSDRSLIIQCLEE